ncbi:MAG: hypothetical protein ACRDI0_08745 [Actinomycetota bacterium]
MSRGVLILQAAVFGPAVAGLAWLAFARSRWARRAVAGALAGGGHAAAWWVLWMAYRGEAPAWEGLEPTLLTSSVVVAAEVGILLAVTRAEARRAGEVPAAVVGTAASASALVVAAWSTSLVVVGLAVPVPTLAAVLAGLSATGRPDVRGHLTLAAADGAALLGLSVIFARTGSTVVGPDSGLGPALLLAAAAAKAGALPGLATWRLVAADGAAGPVSAVLRGQALALAAMAGLAMGGAGRMAVLAAAGAAAVLAAGAAGVLSRRPSGAVAALIGAGAGVPFVALGLGGAVGARAFLVAFPAVLVAAGAATALAEAAPPVRWFANDPRDRRPVRSAAGALALGVAVASVAAAPVGGGFPGAWLSLSLAAVRGRPLAGLAAGGAALGLGLAILGAVALLRWARPRPAATVLGVPAAVALLYMGTQPVRLGIGWWVRIEQELGLPAVLPSAGAPALPALPGSHLLVAAAPALAVVVAVVLVGRGFRDPSPGFAPLRPTRRRPPRSGPVAAVRRRGEAVVARASALALGFGVALVVEAAAVVMAIRLLFLGSAAGFL